MNKENKRSRPNPITSPLFTCKTKQCRNKYQGTTNQTRIDSNRVEVQCPTCQTYWVVCITCQCRFHPNNTYLANRHFDKEHSSNKASTQNLNNSIVEFTSTNESNDSIVDDTTNVIQQCLATSSLPPNSQKFFSTKLNHYLMQSNISWDNHLLNQQHHLIFQPSKSQHFI